MKTTSTQTEQDAGSAQAGASGDFYAMSKLCQDLWVLGRRDEAMAVFHRLLQAEASPGDERFDTVYLAGLTATTTCPVPLRRRNRLMNLVALLESTASVAGDVVECGCFRGMSSYVLCSFMQEADAGFNGAGFHIFDSFQGLSEPTMDDEIPEGWENAGGLRRMSRPGSFSASLAEVRSNLRAFPRIAYHAGWIPLSYERLKESRYRFVHVDVDLYDPTLDTYRYFYPRLANGGVIVSDDYSWPGARTATHEFVAETGVELTVTRFNQAVLRKTERR